MLDEWHLQGPDAENNVWLHIGSTSHNLGPLDQALQKFGEFLAANDYEERVSDGIPFDPAFNQA